MAPAFYQLVGPIMTKVAAISGIFLAVWLDVGVMTVPAQKSKPVASKIDEFSSLRHCDVGARMDLFAMNLMENPTAVGTMIAYGAPGEGPGTAHDNLERIKDYLVNQRGMAPDRFRAIYGGRNDDLTQPRIQFWIVPDGAAPPKPQKFKTNIETFQGLFADYQVGDDFGVTLESDMGPGIGSSVDASFADMIVQQKNATGYVVVYSGDNIVPGAWRRIGQDQLDYLKAFKLDLSRVKLVFGGYQEQTKVQLWLSPPGAPPMIDAAEAPLAKTVQAGDFYVNNLNERNEKAFLKNLVDTLRADSTVRAFLVVRMEQPAPPPDEEEQKGQQPEPIEPVDLPIPEGVEPEAETPPVDVAKLIEKWRTELINTHKIAADRLIVVFTTADEYSPTQLSLWIVPKGAPLPDPHADEQAEDPKPDPRQ